MIDLTAEEQENARAALRFLRARAGNWAMLGKAIGFRNDTLKRVADGRYPATARIVIRVARFANVGVDDVLKGRYPSPGTCPTCGRPSVL